MFCKSLNGKCQLNDVLVAKYVLNADEVSVFVRKKCIGRGVDLEGSKSYEAN